MRDSIPSLHHYPHVSALFLLSASLLGCSDSPTEAIREAPGELAFSFSNGPANPSPVVFRGLDPNVEQSYGDNATGTVTFVSGGTAQVSRTVRWKTTGEPGVRATSHLHLSNRP